MDKGMECDGEMTEKIVQGDSSAKIARGDSSDKINSTQADSESKLILPPKKQYMHSHFKSATSCCEQLLPIFEWQSNSNLGGNVQAPGSSRDLQQTFPATQQTNVDTTMSTQEHHTELDLGYQCEITTTDTIEPQKCAQVSIVHSDSKDNFVFKKPIGRAPKPRQKHSNVKRPSRVEETSPLPSNLSASASNRAISGESCQQQQQQREPIRQSVIVFAKKKDPPSRHF